MNTEIYTLTCRYIEWKVTNGFLSKEQNESSFYRLITVMLCCLDVWLVGFHLETGENLSTGQQAFKIKLLVDEEDSHAKKVSYVDTAIVSNLFQILHPVFTLSEGTP